MKDGRQGTRLAAGAAIRVPDTNLLDRPTIRVYDANGNEIYSKQVLLLPFGGERWEQKWNGSELVEDKDK